MLRIVPGEVAHRVSPLPTCPVSSAPLDRGGRDEDVDRRDGQSCSRPSDACAGEELLTARLAEELHGVVAGGGCSAGREQGHAGAHCGEVGQGGDRVGLECAKNVGQFCPQGQTSAGATVGELVEGEPKSGGAQQSEDPVG